MAKPWRGRAYVPYPHCSTSFPGGNSYRHTLERLLGMPAVRAQKGKSCNFGPCPGKNEKLYLEPKTLDLSFLLQILSLLLSGQIDAVVEIHSYPGLLIQDSEGE